jgi:hypothetical protein
MFAQTRPAENVQEKLTARHFCSAGGEFKIDWSRSGAVDHSSFTPNNHSDPADPGLDVTYNMQYSCCGKSAFTKSGRRTLLHAGVQNSGSNPKENAFSLARDVFFDQQGLLRQTFVPELAVLRGSHHAPQRYAVRAGATDAAGATGGQAARDQGTTAQSRKQPWQGELVGPHCVWIVGASGSGLFVCGCSGFGWKTMV